VVNALFPRSENAVPATQADDAGAMRRMHRGLQGINDSCTQKSAFVRRVEHAMSVASFAFDSPICGQVDMKAE
jgi:hypothetical protein